MKNRRRAWIRWASALLALASLLALLAVRPDCPPDGPTPAVSISRDVSGPLRAGAARVTFTLPTRVSRAGFPAPQPLAVASDEAPAPAATALVLEAEGLRLALVSVDLLLVPEALRDAVRARLQRGVGADTGTELLLVATHTHSGPGGFDARLLAGLAGTGWPQEAVMQAIEDAVVEAVELASARRAPAELAWHAREAVEGLNRTRTEGVAASGRLNVLRVRTANATHALVLVAAHPTLAGREGALLEVDYPGRTSLHSGEDGVTLVLQGAGGNASAPASGRDGPARAEAYADRLEAAVTAMVETDAGPAPAMQRASPARAQSRALGREPTPAVFTSPKAGALGAALAAGAPSPRAPLPDGAAGAATGPVPRASVAVGLRRFEISTPRPDAARLVPSILRGATERALCHLAPRTAELSLVTLGPVRLLFVPAEVTGALEPALLEAAGADALVSLADGYLGYAEATALVKQGRGEAHRQLFEPSLAQALIQAARMLR